MSIDTIRDGLDINEFEIARSGFGNFPTLSVVGTAGQFSSGESQTIIAHNLGYTPALAINIALKSGSNTQGLPCPYENNSFTATTGIFGILQAYADQTNLYLLSDLMVYGNTTGVIPTGFVAQYYLLKEKVKRIV